MAAKQKATKRVRMLTSIASAAWSYGSGEVVELDAAQADAWIASGIAEPADEGGGA
jgi:hypothetical protein